MRRPFSARCVLKSQNPHNALFRVQSIDDQIRTDREKSTVRFLRQPWPHLGRISKRFGLCDQFQTKSLGGCRIVTRNIFYDLLKIISAARRKDYFQSHERTA